jgi:hypothetical protein
MACLWQQALNRLSNMATGSAADGLNDLMQQLHSLPEQSAATWTNLIQDVQVRGLLIDIACSSM